MKENVNEDYSKLNETPCSRNIRYGYIKFINVLDDVHWRINDELSGIKNSDTRGGFFKRQGEWINELSIIELSTIEQNIIQIKKIMKKDDYDKNKYLRLNKEKWVN